MAVGMGPSLSSSLFSQKPVSWEMKGDFLVVFMGWFPPCKCCLVYYNAMEFHWQVFCEFFCNFLAIFSGGAGKILSFVLCIYLYLIYIIGRSSSGSSSCSSQIAFSATWKRIFMLEWGYKFLIQMIWFILMWQKTPCLYRLEMNATSTELTQVIEVDNRT